ncbi:hypothetical protein [Pinibacter aurantiacus]|uniref:Uncharacterized protein n=1 Tax=Pinibacter aurantiacus TaxID=2851599 RepID=A0A9E2SBF2_9BACT|nr:hypothetical protein [Pinibacter aurantiacus]MBV4359886.1 hypothetical protein [Pinibacter aurantiacus]
MALKEDILRNFYKDGTKEWHWGKIILDVVFVLALLIVCIYGRNRKQKLDAERIKNHRYTIGITGKKHHGIKSSQPSVEFYYVVSYMQYNRNQTVGAQYEDNLISNGGRYYVEFSSKDPGNSVLLLGEPVPDAIQSCPDTGWINLPTYFVR